MVSFFRLKSFKGFGGGGGAPRGVPCLSDWFLAVSIFLLEVSFLCFLKGFIFFNSSSGGGGGPGGGGLWANTCEPMHSSPINNGSIKRYFDALVSQPFLQ